ncbi:MAG: hypothetical protein IPH59_07355 [bacterium]|nr:hypothetical protein [bacterium]
MSKLDDLDKQRKGNANDLEILEEIQAKIVEELRNKEINPRVGDLLKALELKMKLKLSQDDKEKIWELLNQLRDEELNSDEDSDSSS